MAKGYEVLVNGATIHHHLAPAYDASGNEISEEVTSVIHMAGDVIPDEELAEHVKRTYKDKDDPQYDHIRSLLKRTSSSKSETTSDESGSTETPTSPSEGSGDGQKEETPQSLSDFTNARLDELGVGLDGYPTGKKGAKPEKVAFLEKAGVKP